MRLSLPRALLHAEGAAVLIASLLLYAQHGIGWGWFALLLLSPDLSMVGYLGGMRVGSIAYNAAHTYLAPAALALLMLLGLVPTLWALPLIWSAHIGMDRMVGYGLKYPTGFKDTHLARA